MIEQNNSVAIHLYLKPKNISEERCAFLSPVDYTPKFIYPKHYIESSVLSRMEKFDEGSAEKAILNCVLSSIRLQADKNELDNFRRINKDIFGEPSKELANSLMTLMLNYKSENWLDYKDYILDKVNILEPFDNINIIPRPETFLKYKQYLDDYRKNDSFFKYDVPATIQNELLVSGLSKKGWVLRLVSSDRHAITKHREKSIVVGAKYVPRKYKAAERIAVHEVYGHALRGPQNSLMEGEGFALVLEQLLAKKFRFRRSYRYLATCLGWGIFGKEMNFREVFEVMWRIMKVLSGYSENDAKRHAFDECQRVFRGGRNDIAGAVFLKDAVYFEANISIWNKLSENKINYDEFVNILEGRSTIIS